eukprot:g35089.t1
MPGLRPLPLLGPDIVHQLEDGQLCSGIPSAHTPAQMEIHIGRREPILHNLSHLQNIDRMDCRGVKRWALHMFLILGDPVQRGAGRSEDLLVVLAKLVIDRSRQRAVEGVTYTDCLLLFCGYVQAWMSLEKEHVEFTNNPDAFRERWAAGDGNLYFLFQF